MNAVLVDLRSAPPVRTNRRSEDERSELIGYLSTLSASELSAYCSGVLSAYALHSPPAIVEAVSAAMAKPRTSSNLAPVICLDCGDEIERTGRPGRPRRRHAACPARAA